jgi:tripartite-type tricarboxylate transporter receptor subunit TctC
LAEKLQTSLGQPIVIVNRPGAGGVIGALELLQSPADGYTLYAQAVSTMNPSLVANLTFSTLEDLAPVAPFWEVHYILWVNDTVEATTLAEFIDYGKAHPGELNYGMGTLSTRLAMDMLKVQAGLDMIGIPYQGSAPTSVGLLSNEIQSTFDVIGPYRAQLTEGKVRALAVTGPERDPELPDIPTIAEAGYPDLQMTLIGGLWAPAGVPDDVVKIVNDAVNEALASPDIQAAYQAQGWKAQTGTSQEMFDAVTKETDFWVTAAAAANYVPE